MEPLYTELDNEAADLERTLYDEDDLPFEVTRRRLIRAFDAWHKDCLENPDNYDDLVEDAYGELCADALINFLSEVRG